MTKEINRYINEDVKNKIHTIRSLQVMLDSDLAEFYGVETRALNQAVMRNSERFPEEFMFKLTEKESNSLRSQFATLNTTSRGTHTTVVVLTCGALAVLYAEIPKLHVTIVISEYRRTPIPIVVTFFVVGNKTANTLQQNLVRPSNKTTREAFPPNFPRNCTTNIRS